MIKDCPNIKRKKNKRSRFKPKTTGKRAMVATWSDSDSSECESEYEKIANHYLMARDSAEESDEFEELILEFLLTFTKEYLAQCLLKCVKYE